MTIAHFARYLKVAGASENTIRHRCSVIRRLGCDPLTASPGHLLGFLAQYDSPATRKSYRGALRCFYGWAADNQLVDADPSARLPRITVPRGTPRPVTDEALARLIRMAPDDTMRAVILVMAYCGLRGKEAAGLHRDDFVCDSDGVWRLRVVGKGGHAQVVPCPEHVAARARDHFPLPYGLTPMRSRLTRLFVRAGVPGTPHCLRHWYATTALRVCGNVRVVQSMMRHRSLSSTQIYTEVADAETAAVAVALPRIA